MGRQSSDLQSKLLASLLDQRRHVSHGCVAGATVGGQEDGDRAWGRWRGHCAAGDGDRAVGATGLQVKRRQHSVC